MQREDVKNVQKKAALWRGMLALVITFGLMAGLLSGRSMTASAANADPAIGETVKIERVDAEWYVIGISSETVTLFAKKSFADKSFNDKNGARAYQDSTIKTFVEGLVSPGQPLARIKNALATVHVKEPDVSGAVPYLLSVQEANKVSEEMRKDSDSSWWLRSSAFLGAAFMREDGKIDVSGNGVALTRGVRPALQLKKSAVKYVPETKTFSLLMGHQHHFTYTVNGHTITAKCDPGCPVSYDTQPAVLTLRTENGTYNGHAYTGAVINATDWTAAGLTLPVIEYAGRGSTAYAASRTAPTDAGTYTAGITVNPGVSAKAAFTINPKEVFIHYATPRNREYAKGDKTIAISAVEFRDRDGNPVSLKRGKNADYTVTGEMNTDTADPDKVVQVAVTLLNSQQEGDCDGEEPRQLCDLCDGQ